MQNPKLVQVAGLPDSLDHVVNDLEGLRAGKYYMELLESNLMQISFSYLTFIIWNPQLRIPYTNFESDSQLCEECSMYFHCMTKASETRVALANSVTAVKTNAPAGGEDRTQYPPIYIPLSSFAGCSPCDVSGEIPKTADEIHHLLGVFATDDTLKNTGAHVRLLSMNTNIFNKYRDECLSASYVVESTEVHDSLTAVFIDNRGKPGMDSSFQLFHLRAAFTGAWLKGAKNEEAQDSGQ